MQLLETDCIAHNLSNEKLKKMDYLEGIGYRIDAKQDYEYATSPSIIKKQKTKTLQNRVCE